MSQSRFRVLHEPKKRKEESLLSKVAIDTAKNAGRVHLLAGFWLKNVWKLWKWQWFRRFRT